MKTYFFLFSLLLIILRCSGQSSTLILYANADVRSIHFWPLNGDHLPFYSLSSTADLDSGKVEIHLPIADCTYRILAGDKSFQIYTAAGSTDTVSVYDNLLFTGDNHRYNAYLTTVDASDQYCRDYSISSTHQLATIDKLSDFNQVIDSLTYQDMLLLKNNNFTDQFMNQQQLNITMRYTALRLKKMHTLYQKNKLSDNWIDQLKGLDTDFLSQTAATQSDWFYEIAQDYALLRSVAIEEISPREIISNYHQLLFESYIKILEGHNQEYAIAYLIYEDIAQQKFSEDIPMLYERFHSRFPGSTYNRILAPGVNKITALYGRHDEFGISWLHYNTEPQSLEEMLRPFLGKTIYIDLWATWCAPCLAEFPYLEDLKKEFHQMEDVVFLYISLDRDRDHKKWEKMVGYYGLKGYHYRVNENTVKIVHTTLGDKQGLLAIPRYIIIDKTGHIAIANAAAPSDPDKVRTQIKSILK